MGKQFLDLDGVNALWGKIKGRVVELANESAMPSSGSDYSAGTLLYAKDTGKLCVVCADKSIKAIYATDLKSIQDEIQAAKDGTWTSTGTNIVTATGDSSLTENDIVVGANGDSTVKASGKKIATTVTATNQDDQVPTSDAVIDYVNEQLLELKEAAIDTYVISVASNDAWSSYVKNADLKTEDDPKEISYIQKATLYCISGPGTGYPKEVLIASLKIGDGILIQETGYPDRWISNKTLSTSAANGILTCSRLETQKVDLTNYLTKATATSVSGYGANKTISGVSAGTNNELTISFQNIVLGNINQSGQITKSTSSILYSQHDTEKPLYFIVATSDGTLYKSTISTDELSSSTNYFLSKTGAWAQVDMSSAILKSLLTAKGQIIYASASKTPAVLNGPTVASGTTAILSYSNSQPTWDTLSAIPTSTINALP